jgi:hypothetical protein
MEFRAFVRHHQVRLRPLAGRGSADPAVSTAPHGGHAHKTAPKWPHAFVTICAPGVDLSGHGRCVGGSATVPVLTPHSPTSGRACSRFESSNWVGSLHDAYLRLQLKRSRRIRGSLAARDRIQRDRDARGDDRDPGGAERHSRDIRVADGISNLHHARHRDHGARLGPHEEHQGHRGAG